MNVRRLADRRLRPRSREPLMPIPASAFKGAREDPTKYPGERPDGSYLLYEGQVHLMDFDNPKDPLSGHVYIDGKRVLVDRFLSEHGLTPMAKRIMVGAYGSNPCPGQLAKKWTDRKNEGVSDATVVFSGTLADADVVPEGCSVYGGYLYASIILNEMTKGTNVDFWYTLLDPQQLQILNKDEITVVDGIPDYAVASMKGCTIDGTGLSMTPLIYAGNGNLFISKKHNSPIAFGDIKADNRRMPEYGGLEILRLILSHEESGMAEEVFKLLKIGGSIKYRLRELGGDVKDRVRDALFEVNRQYREGGIRRDSPHMRVIEMVRGYLRERSTSFRLVDKLREEGALVERAYADSAPEEYQFGRLLENAGRL